ncbi:bidirectional sugar transporter SWEET6b-like [Phalaenopsis equestris]|uniref:bidirectional sugar transporter SWEET6b-like n=1 Tax=Phalaenopsis equestris TaxID=78828 RepID=UPI0009E570B6|nr:bidirectional sugar transporter SWEET6b-like [Phalaenopsis equestris]
MLSNAAIRNIVGIIGNVISLGLFLSPAPTLVKIWRKKSVEQFSPIPYQMMLINCMLWVFYGLPIVHPNTILVSTINGAGVIIVSCYLSLFFFFSPKETRMKVMKVLAGELVFMAVVVTLALTAAHTHDLRSLIVGVLSIIICICMYASPLSIMKLVMKTKSVKYMPFWLSLAGFLNGICWSLYALIKLDVFILIPNGLGAILGLLQLLLYAFYYKSTPVDEHEDKEKKVAETA